ncbi:MAG: hypothetical protein M0042_01440 [Nitrospiraceae bacterium]|nr:hypothetical protein [Nitrospiraceae bacterium]
MRKQTTFIMLFSLTFIVFSADCSRTTEEDKVRKVITTVQKAAEEKRIAEVLEHVSRSYADPKGNDYNAIKGIVAYYFFQHQNISIAIPTIDVALTEKGATANFQAILSGGGTAGATTQPVLPDALGAYNFNVTLGKEEGKWKVLSATWERLGDVQQQQ